MASKRARRWLSGGLLALLLVAGLVLGLAAWFTSEAVEDQLLVVTGPEPTLDPSAVGVEFEIIDVPGPLGNYPAWLVAAAPDEDSWAIHVHDRAHNREQALPILSTFADHGLGVLATTYRNVAGAPPGDGGHYALGADEWQDLEAAVLYALDSGAEDVVLIGSGSGGGVVLSFLAESESAGWVAGIVLDAPYLDPGSMVDIRRREASVPGFLIGWGKAMATFRFGIDWAEVDHLARAAEVEVPVLLFYGTADQTVPAEHIAEFVGAVGGVRYVSFEGAAHLEAVDMDPERYAASLGHFLRTVAVGPSELGEPVPETGAE